MKLKLIDEKFLDEYIKEVSVFPLDTIDEHIIATIERIKEQLLSPVEPIKKAFEAGQEYGFWKDDISYDPTSTPNLEEYLKQEWYES